MVYILVYGILTGIWYTYWYMVYVLVYGIRTGIWHIYWYMIYVLLYGIRTGIWYTYWYMVYLLVYGICTGIWYERTITLPSQFVFAKKRYISSAFIEQPDQFLNPEITD